MKIKFSWTIFPKTQVKLIAYLSMVFSREIFQISFCNSLLIISKGCQIITMLFLKWSSGDNLYKMTGNIESIHMNKPENGGWFWRKKAPSWSKDFENENEIKSPPAPLFILVISTTKFDWLQDVYWKIKKNMQSKKHQFAETRFLVSPKNHNLVIHLV